MSLFEVCSLIIGGLGLVVSTVVLLFLLKQVKLLSRQVEDSRRALDFASAQAEAENNSRKRRATMDFISGTMSKLQELYGHVPAAASPRQEQFLADAMVRDSQAFLAVRNYLNYLEDVAVGTNMGIFDKSTVYRASGGRMVRAWQSYESWILEERRQVAKTLYGDLEACATELRSLR